MSDGTAPVKKEDAANSATRDKPFNELILYTLWRPAAVAGQEYRPEAFERGSYTDFTVAREAARRDGCYITEQKIIADYTR